MFMLNKISESESESVIIHVYELRKPPFCNNNVYKV